MTDKIAASSLFAGNTQMIAEMARMRAQATGAPMAASITQASLPTPTFSAVLDGAINHVDNLQHAASNQQRAVEMGTSDDLTGAILESQKASVAFSALIQVRNKLTSAFDEIINISL